MLISSSHLSSTYNILAYISPQKRSTHNSVLDVRGILHFHSFPSFLAVRSAQEKPSETAPPGPPIQVTSSAGCRSSTATRRSTSSDCSTTKDGRDGREVLGIKAPGAQRRHGHGEKMGNWGENILTHWENDHEFWNYHVVVSLPCGS